MTAAARLMPGRGARDLKPAMQIDVSFLPALAAAFMLVFARIGTMVMLLPGLGELSVPVRVRLTVALVLAAVLLPLHRAAYPLDLRSFGPVLVMLGEELLIGAVLGLTARLTISALQVAGSVIAQQLGLGFVTAVDPTQGQQGVIVGNFLSHARRHADLRHRSASSGDRRAQRQLHAVPPGRDSAPRRHRGADHPHASRPHSASASSSRRRSWCSGSCSISGSACCRG